MNEFLTIETNENSLYVMDTNIIMNSKLYFFFFL